MRNLNEFIFTELNESILDDAEDIMAEMDKNAELFKLHKFFEENYEDRSFEEIGHYPNYEKTNMLKGEVINLDKKTVSLKAYKTSIIKLAETATQLLPDGWTFDTVTCHFDISGSQVKDLSQAPKKCGNNLYMNNCVNITSFTGNIEKIKGNLFCQDCPNLKSWEGLPEVKGMVRSKGTPLPDEKLNETPESCPTLYDCMKNHIKNFAFERSLGPTHYENIMAAASSIKKKYKPTEIRSVNGNRADPQVLGNIIFGIAPYVKIDYSLPVEKRITDAYSQFKKLYDDVVDKIEDAGGLHIYFDPDPVIFKRYDRSGIKSMYAKNGVGLEIGISYATGNFLINLDEQSPLFM